MLFQLLELPVAPRRSESGYGVQYPDRLQAEHVGRTLHDVEQTGLALSSPNTVSLFVKMSEFMEFIYLAVFLFLPKYRPVNAMTRPMRSRMGIITRSRNIA